MGRDAKNRPPSWEMFPFKLGKIGTQQETLKSFIFLRMNKTLQLLIDVFANYWWIFGSVWTFFGSFESEKWLTSSIWQTNFRLKTFQLFFVKNPEFLKEFRFDSIRISLPRKNKKINMNIYWNYFYSVLIHLDQNWLISTFFGMFLLLFDII